MTGELKPQRANLNDSLTPDELTLELAEKLFSTPQEGRSLGVDPETGHEIVAKDGRYGPYVTEVLPEPESDDDDGAGRRQEGQEADGSQAAHRLAAAVDGPGDGDARGRAAAAVAAAGRRRRSRTPARRSPRRTAATAHISSAAPTLARWRPRSRCSTSRSTRR